MKSTLRVIKSITNVICWILIIFFVSVVIFAFVTRVSGESPVIGGYSIYRVSSGSMEPQLSVGDIILDKEVENPKTLEVGDIITFDGSGVTEGYKITHKIIKAPYENEDGEWVLQTQGIANDLPDGEISLDRVRGIYVRTIPFLSVIYDVFLSIWGLLIIIALFVIIFIDEVINIVKILTGKEKTPKDAEDINDIISLINESDGGSRNDG